MNITNFEKQKTNEKVGKIDSSRALVPIIPEEKKSDSDSERVARKYRKGQKEHIIYTRIYLLFFFVGACVFASGKWESATLSEKTLTFLIKGATGFSDFCSKYALVIFGSFLVYASGFTVYASLLSVIYSALTFLFFGIASGSIVFLHGVGLETFLFIAVLGLLCVACIIFCSVTAGISKIASSGIEKLRVFDGILYSVLYWGYILGWYYGIKGLCMLIPA